MNPIDVIKIKKWLCSLGEDLEFKINNDDSLDLYCGTDLYLDSHIPFKIQKFHGSITVENFQSFENFPLEISNDSNSCSIFSSKLKYMSELPLKRFGGERLLIMDCGLEEIDAFPESSKIKSIKITNNRIKSVKNLPKNILDLNLSANKIEEFDYPCYSLCYLYLDKNPINSFGQLKELDFLKISVTDLNDAEEMIKKLKDIKIHRKIEICYNIHDEKESKEIEKIFDSIYKDKFIKNINISI